MDGHFPIVCLHVCTRACGDGGEGIPSWWYVCVTLLLNSMPVHHHPKHFCSGLVPKPVVDLRMEPIVWQALVSTSRLSFLSQ